MLSADFPGDADRLSSDLLADYDENTAAPDEETTDALSTPDTTQVEPMLTDPSGRVGVVITADDADALAPLLSQMGMVVADTLPTYHRIEGFVDLADLPAISELGDQGLMGITAVPMPIASSGTIDAQSDDVLEADRVRAALPGYNGSGIKIATLSDSYDKSSLVTRASASVSSGNLPNNVQVVQDFNSSGYSASVEDEGRAMLELIYDLDPGASLGFATADISEAQFATNIQTLANDGYKVIADDITYFDEPFFQDGILATAINNVVSNKGVDYFTAAGNIDTQSYDTGATNSYGANPLNFASDTIASSPAVTGNFLDFDPTPAVNDKMSFSLAKNGSSGEGIEISLQWDQPYYTTNGVTSNVDVYLVQDSNSKILAKATTNNITSQTPDEVLNYVNTTNASVPVHLMFRLTSGTTPGRIKFDNYGSNGYGDVNFGTFATNSSTINPHSAATGDMSVGAAPFFQQNAP